MFKNKKSHSSLHIIYLRIKVEKKHQIKSYLQYKEKSHNTYIFKHIKLKKKNKNIKRKKQNI